MVMKKTAKTTKVTKTAKTAKTQDSAPTLTVGERMRMIAEEAQARAYEEVRQTALRLLPKLLSQIEGAARKGDRRLRVTARTLRSLALHHHTGVGQELEQALRSTLKDDGLTAEIVGYDVGGGLNIMW